MFKIAYDAARYQIETHNSISDELALLKPVCILPRLHTIEIVLICDKALPASFSLSQLLDNVATTNGTEDEEARSIILSFKIHIQH
jgi:hypothetical protein